MNVLDYKSDVRHFLIHYETFRLTEYVLGEFRLWFSSIRLAVLDSLEMIYILL